MSTARQPRQTRPAPTAARPADISALRQRRLQARRRRRLARVDVGVGVLAGLMLLILSPGLAISGAIALLVLVVCAGSVLLQRRRRRHAAGAAQGRRPVAGSARRELERALAG